MHPELMYKSPKGKIAFHSDTCVVCGTCQYVCPAGAISIEKSSDTHSIDFRIWHNTCTLCGNCEYFCPTNSIYFTHGLNEVNLQENKYKNTSSGTIHYVKCTECGKEMIQVAETLLKKGFGYLNDDISKLSHLCPECRQKATFKKRVKVL